MSCPSTDERTWAVPLRRSLDRLLSSCQSTRSEGLFRSDSIGDRAAWRTARPDALCIATPPQRGRNLRRGTGQQQAQSFRSSSPRSPLHPAPAKFVRVGPVVDSSRSSMSCAVTESPVKATTPCETERPPGTRTNPRGDAPRTSGRRCPRPTFPLGQAIGTRTRRVECDIRSPIVMGSGQC